MKKVRLGIIGCGSMGKSHQDAFELVKENLEVVATADIIKEKAKDMANYLDAEIWSSDYHDILPHVDAVMLILPHHLHYEVGMECIKHNKHILMEKPMCNTEQECLDMTHYAKENGVVLMVAYCMHYHPLLIKLKQLIDNKTYGDIFQLSIWTEQYTKREDSGWHHNAKTLGGGQLFSHGCHYIDLLLWYLGNPVRGTHIGTNYCTPWMEMEGTSNVSMEFESGALAYHFGTWGAKGTKLGYSFHAHFTEGMVEVSITDGNIKYHKTGEEPITLMEAPLGKNTFNEIAHFADCILNNKEPITNAPDSLQGLRVIWRLYEAEDKNVFADLRGLGYDGDWDQENLSKLP